MEKYLISFLIIFFIFSCKKSGNSPSGPPVVTPPAQPKITYTVDSTSTQPGLLLTLKASEPVRRDTASVWLADKSVVLVKVDSFHYAFYVPVFQPGTYLLDLRNIDAANKPEVVIRNYSVINNADNTINEVMTKYNQLVDSLQMNALDSGITWKDASFMRQIIDQLQTNIALCTPDEKLLLAYQLQNMNLNSSFAQKSNLDTTYLAFKKDGENDDIGKILLYKALEAIRAKIQAFGSVGTVVITAITALAFPNPFTIGTFLVATGNYVYSVKAARKAAVETLDITGIAEDQLSEINGNGTDTKPIVVSIGKTLVESLVTFFRTLRTRDEIDEADNELRDFIKSTYELQAKDETVGAIFENIKSKLSSFFKKITIAYTPYQSPVLQTAKQKLAMVKSRFISVSNVSNSDITIAAVEEGTNGLKLTFDNPSKNLTSETNFTFTLSYNQDAISNKVSVTQKGKFVPLVVPWVTTTVVNSITTSSATSGGIITSDGGSPILSKGVCYGLNDHPIPDISNTVPAGTGPNSFVSVITGLEPDKTYHLRAFAANSTGIGYGDDLSFKTLPAKKPTLTTTAISSITQTTAVSGGAITDDGGATVSARGVCWSTSQNPTIDDSKTSDPLGGSNFTSNLTGLSADKTYHVRAYATNTAGTAYGNDVNFTTKNNDFDGNTWYGYYRCASWDADWGYNPISFPIAVPKGYAPVTIRFSTNTDGRLDAVMTYVWNGTAGSSLSGNLNSDRTQINWTSASSPWGDAVPVTWTVSGNQINGVFTPKGGGCVTSFIFFKL